VAKGLEGRAKAQFTPYFQIYIYIYIYIYFILLDFFLDINHDSAHFSSLGSKCPAHRLYPELASTQAARKNQGMVE
jgi:hypothetical protein